MFREKDKMTSKYSGIRVRDVALKEGLRGAIEDTVAGAAVGRVDSEATSATRGVSLNRNCQRLQESIKKEQRVHPPW